MELIQLASKVVESAEEITGDEGGLGSIRITFTDGSVLAVYGGYEETVRYSVDAAVMVPIP